MQSLWRLSLRVAAVYRCPRARSTRSSCIAFGWYRIGRVATVIRVIVNLVSDACGRNAIAGASLHPKAPPASVERLAVDLRSAILAARLNNLVICCEERNLLPRIV